MTIDKKLRRMAVVAASALALGTGAFADAGHEAAPDIGQTGRVGHIDRTIEVNMGEMYFDPKKYDIQRGETIKFVVTNVGRIVHEFAIGTDDMQRDHEKEMREMQKLGMITSNRLRHDKMRAAGMMHTDPNSRLLEPKEVAELIWTFSGQVDGLTIACNVPGHRQSGMEAPITFTGMHS